MFDLLANVKDQVTSAVSNAVGDLQIALFGEPVDSDPFAMPQQQVSSDDVFAAAARYREQSNAMPTGTGYELSFVHHKHREHHEKPYFFASPLGAPFPSYHTNPAPTFPARWTQIPNINDPCETLTAPRIRLAPRELGNKRTLFEKMRFTGEHEEDQPQLECLNLGYQALGDPYQYEAFVTFMDLNRNVKVLNLTENELEDITDLNLQTVVRLHLSNNNFASFEALPLLPNCEELFLTENFISGLQGATALRLPKVRVITLQQNPIALMPAYRKKLKRLLPTLEYVDGLRVLPDDSSLLGQLLGD